MKKQVFVLSVTAAVLAGPALTPSLADSVPLTSNRNIYINVSNDNGSRLGGGPDGSYLISAGGGGLNQLHITTDSSAAGVSGQVTTQNVTTSTAAGTFWVTTTGGRGYNDTIVLLASIQGPISNDFSLNITSSGYQWTPADGGLGGDVHYVAGAVSETFSSNDFLYGPNIAKPGPGNGWVLPFYSGQVINDPASASYLMFIDLYVGNIRNNSLTDSGSAKVEFTLSGLGDNIVAFNAYAYAQTANIADGSINWTNNLSTNPSAPNQSGYSVVSELQPTPLPPSAWMFGSGLFGVWLVRRRRGRSSKQD